MRNRNSLLFMGLALVLGLAAAFIARSRFETASGPGVEAVLTSRVVIVKAEVPVGTALDAPHLEIVEWPTQFVPEGAFMQSAKLHGRVPRRALSGERRDRSAGHVRS